VVVVDGTILVLVWTDLWWTGWGKQARDMYPLPSFKLYLGHLISLIYGQLLAQLSTLQVYESNNGKLLCLTRSEAIADTRSRNITQVS
jgi:hypothetical protein